VTIYDRIYEMEHKLDEPDRDFLNRRLVLRAALQAVRDEALREGHTEGMRDALDARFAEARAASGEDPDALDVPGAAVTIRQVT
jgi:hypothetical protein